MRCLGCPQPGGPSAELPRLGGADSIVRGPPGDLQPPLCSYLSFDLFFVKSYLVVVIKYIMVYLLTIIFQVMVEQMINVVE